MEEFLITQGLVGGEIEAVGVVDQQLGVNEGFDHDLFYRKRHLLQPMDYLDSFSHRC